MGRTHTQLAARLLDNQIDSNGNLIALNSPNFQDASIEVAQFEFIAFEENRTTIGAVVLFDVQTRRIRFGEENALVVLGAQNGLKEFEMIDFLKMNLKWFRNLEILLLLYLPVNIEYPDCVVKFLVL